MVTPHGRWWPWLVVAVTLVVALTRVGDTSLWLDEGSTSIVVRGRSFVGLAFVLGHQYSVFFPYLVALWGWAQISETDEWLRMFSVAGGLVSIGVICSLARRWFGMRASVLAACLCLASPYFLRYLTELRGYSWSMALSALVLWSLDRALRGQRRVDALVLGVLCGVMIGNHVLSFFTLPPLLLVLGATGHVTVANLRSIGRPALVAGLVAFAPGVPAMVVNPARQDWIAPIGWSTFGRSLELFVGSWWIGAIVAVGLMAAIVSVVIDKRVGRDWRVVAVVAQAVLTVPLHALVSFVRPVHLERYYAAAFPAVVLAASYGLVRLGRWSAALARRSVTERQWTIAVARDLVLAVGAVVPIVVFVGNGPFSDEERPDDPEAAVEWVLDQIEPGELIVINDFPAAYLPYLGARPDLDPAYVPMDQRKFLRRRLLPEYADELGASPVVYVLGWYTAKLGPGVAELAAERRVAEHRIGDRTTVWVLTATG
jgi:hypothetical protein